MFAIALVVVEFFRLPQPQIFFRMSCFQNEHDTPAGVLKRRSSYCPTLDGSEWEDEEAKGKQSLRSRSVDFRKLKSRSEEMEPHAKRPSRSIFKTLSRRFSSRRFSQRNRSRGQRSGTPSRGSSDASDKQKKRSFLARFLLKRPSKKKLIDAGVIPVDQRDASAINNMWFGVPLRELSERSGMFCVAPVVTWCVQHLQPHMDVEGLFRVSGTFREMDNMKQCFEQGREPDLESIENVHSIAGLLEQYLRELPEPPLTYALYDSFIECVDKPPMQQLLSIQEVVKRLPKPNYALLEVLLPFLKELTDHSEKNLMNAKNMGLVFGPVLLGTAALTVLLEDVDKIRKQNVLIQLLISNADLLFGKFTNPRAHTLTAAEQTAVIKVPSRIYPESESNLSTT